jgi:hypothetical protein
VLADSFFTPFGTPVFRSEAGVPFLQIKALQKI